MIEKFTLVHDVSVHILSDSSFILELLLNELSGFNAYDKVEAPEQVRISIKSCETIVPRPHNGKVYEDKGGVSKFYDPIQHISLTYYSDNVSIRVWQDQSSVYQMECQYRATYTNYLDITSELIYELVYRILIHFRFYPLHSGCIVNSNDHCIVMCGNSFRGKTTLCISALEHGYKILSDDMPLLKKNNEYIEAYSFPRTLRVCNDTIEHFPNLQKHIAYSDREFLYLKNDIAILPEHVPKDIADKMRRGIKSRIFLDAAYEKPVIQSAMPVCLILLTQGEEYSCKEIMPQKAFNTILKDNLMIYSFRGSHKKNYENFSSIIQQLVYQCKLLEISLGTDLDKNCKEFIKSVDAI